MQFIKRNLVVFLIATFAVGMLTTVSVLFGKDRSVELQREEYLSMRNFRYRPFDMADATVVCEFEAKQRHGEEFLRSHFDSHSSRYEDLRKTFFVVLRGDIGTIDIYDEMLIYCHIDPRQHVVTYYKATYPEQRSFWSGGGKFFN